MPSVSYMALTFIPQSHRQEMTANIKRSFFVCSVLSHRANVKRRFGLCRVGVMPMLASETLSPGLIRTFLCGNKFKLKKDRLGPSRIGQRNEFVPRIGKPRPQCQHVWESRIFRNIPIPLLDSL